MTHLKKMFFALAVALGLGLLGTSSALAQVNCTAFSVPTLVRSQGLTEVTGAISLNCAGGVLTATTANITVTITPPTAVVTNDAAAGNPIAANTGTATIGVITVSGNTVTIPIASAAGAQTLGTVTISAIRVNASASGVVFPAQIAALLTASPATAISVSNNQLNVAIPQNGFTATFSSGAGLPQCSSSTFAGASDAPGTITVAPNAGSGGAAAGAFSVNGTTTIAGKTISGGTAGKITVSEGFPAAFHTRAHEGADASNGTRILITLGTLPSNVVVYALQRLNVEATGFTGNAVLDIVSGAGADGSGATSPPAAGSATTESLITGNTITYEVTTDNDAQLDGFVVPIQFYTTGTATLGTITATATIAPTSTIGTATTSGGVLPRFTAGTASGTATSIIGCTTNILFPFVTNQLGFNTGFSIANTTTDPFGTSSQSGTCVYNFYGTNAPSGGTFTTPSISGGASDTELLSTVAPNFQGYIIVQCNFQLGHGFFFIQNGFGGGTPNVAQGGPGLIILQPGTTGGTSRKGLAAVGPPFGEGLNH